MFRAFNGSRETVAVAFRLKKIHLLFSIVVPPQ